MLMGMVQPDFGNATILGEDFRSLRPETRAKVAYLAEGHPLYRWMTVGEAAWFTASFYPNWNDKLLAQVLDHFSISRKAKIGRLSLGQKAQVSLALALAQDPQLLVLDDPTLGLDTVVRREFLESMIELIQHQGRTIFFSSHILGDVERVADRIGILSDGVLRVDCTTDQFKAALRRVVLTFASEVPPLSPCPGMVSQRCIGNQLELVILHYGPDQAAWCNSLGAQSTEVVEMNLEDAFIAYTRNANRPSTVQPQEAVAC
jgi:ABC-2 type transport system ATP-binding protein